MTEGYPVTKDLYGFDAGAVYPCDTGVLVLMILRKAEQSATGLRCRLLFYIRRLSLNHLYSA